MTDFTLDPADRAVLRSLHGEAAAIATGIARVTARGVPIAVGAELEAAANCIAEGCAHLSLAARCALAADALSVEPFPGGALAA